MQNDMQIDQIKNIIEKSDNIVFFGGAGVSTESGIPDFRSADGIYHQKYAYPPEQILGYSFFTQHPDVFYQFYREKILDCSINAKPNAAHIKLAEWEKQNKLKAVITQNIDTLHEEAGSKNVLHLHGKIEDNYCNKCNKYFSLDEINKQKGIAYCDACGGVIHPGIVLYEESLDAATIEKSIQYISDADVLIIGGTSLSVYPAAGFIQYYRGNKMIFINMVDVSNHYINYFIQGKVGEVLSQMP